MDTNSFQSTELLTTDQLSALFPQFHRNYWPKLRCRGDGPRFVKIGNRVLYPARSIQEWLAGKAVSNTTEAKRRAAG